eukprot:comp22136_c0_seq1/m.51741 comp22136_c0_seq1/g.51741  ORF comp22136_c0_seq1/g.51741 comp22136_c0_seq1/m.51741 type:complete len:353 (+) comp22136_c0_seq1:229-1287(+)
MHPWIAFHCNIGPRDTGMLFVDRNLGQLCVCRNHHPVEWRQLRRLSRDNHGLWSASRCCGCCADPAHIGQCALCACDPRPDVIDACVYCWHRHGRHLFWPCIDCFCWLARRYAARAHWHCELPVHFAALCSECYSFYGLTGWGRHYHDSGTVLCRAWRNHYRCHLWWNRIRADPALALCDAYQGRDVFDDHMHNSKGGPCNHIAPGASPCQCALQCVPFCHRSIDGGNIHLLGWIWGQDCFCGSACVVHIGQCATGAQGLGLCHIGNTRLGSRGDTLCFVLFVFFVVDAAFGLRCCQILRLGNRMHCAAIGGMGGHPGVAAGRSGDISRDADGIVCGSAVCVQGSRQHLFGV